MKGEPTNIEIAYNLFLIFIALLAIGVCATLIITRKFSSFDSPTLFYGFKTVAFFGIAVGIRMVYLSIKAMCPKF